MTVTTLEQHLLAEFEAAQVEHATPFEIFTSGYAIGLKNGQTIKDDVIETRCEQARQTGVSHGIAKGLTQAAYMASHVSTVDIHAGMRPEQAAASMRESITAALSLERDQAKRRAEG